MGIRDCTDILNLARELIEANPGNLTKLDAYFSHVRDSYDVAGEVVDIILSKYHGLKKYLDKQEISLAVGLHDIGRPLRKDQLFHELRGARYIEEHGLEKGISDKITDVYRIAQMVRSHFVVAEQFADETNIQQREEFEPLDPVLLVPRTWQEAIVIYSELSNVNGKRVSIQERIQDIQKRYAPGSDWVKSNPSLVKSMEKGLSRVLETCERVQRLKEGELKEEEIGRYGFI